MIRKSPMKKSPIQKLSPYANKIVNAASSAVQHGTQLSNAVVHKANAKAGESFDKILLRSPPSDDNEKKLLKSPLRRKERQDRMTSDARKRSPPRYSSGVRDRINQFDSASKSSSNVAISGRPISSQSPYYRSRGGNNRRYQTSLSPGMTMNSVRRKEDGSSSNRDGEDDSDRAARDESKANGSDDIMPIPEKENELNFTQKLSPSRKMRKKKNKVDKRHEQQYEMESSDGSKVITSGDGMKSSSTGKEEDFDKGDDRKKNMVSEEDILNNDIDQHSQSAVWNGKSSRGNINQPQKKSNHHHHHSKASDDNMTIEQLNRAAVTSSSKNNVNNDHDTHTKSSTTATKHHHRNTTLLTDNNVIPKSFLDQSTTTTRKREESPTRHELIQSPLRKHIKVVHESACSNATCTMMKEPFQLMLPSQLDQQEKERGRSSNNNHSSEGRKHENEDDEEEGYLDTLGVVMGNNNNTPSKMTRGSKYSDDNNIDASSSTNGKKDEKEAAAALDLLSSAAFLFKTSRRNLG